MLNKGGMLMPKTPKKMRSISITIPKELDDFLNRVVEVSRNNGEHLTKSSLITQVIALSLYDAKSWMEEKSQKDSQKGENE